jgi:hypothetical protein
MNNLLEPLLMKDTLALQGYARFDGLIARIFINRGLLNCAIFASDGRGTIRPDDATLKFTVIMAGYFQRPLHVQKAQERIPRRIFRP